MKLEDYISESIYNYPSLYKDVDYEKSRLKVLNQIFFVNGNGMKFAETENPNDGGYVVDKKYSKGGVFKYDKPYGKVKHKKLSDDYFNSIVYSLSATTKPIETVVKKSIYGTTVYYIYDEKIKKSLFKPKLDIENNYGPFKPYPICEYSIAMRAYANDIFLQNDWVQGLIDVSKRALLYYNNEEEFKNSYYYYSEFSVNITKDRLREKYESSDEYELSDVKKEWGDKMPTNKTILAKHKVIWEKHQSKQIDYLKNLINKYETK